MNYPLDTVAESQGQWSATATAHKGSFERTRALVFALSILAALLAAVASQRADAERQYLAVASAMSMGLATFLTGRLLNLQRSQIWVRARAASEALKREAFKFAAEGCDTSRNLFRSLRALSVYRPAVDLGVCDC